MEKQADLSNYNHSFSIKNKIMRLVWNIFYVFLFRPFVGKIFRHWRVFLLNIFGARVSYKAHVYCSVKIWAPWNLVLGEYSTLGPSVDCYNQGKIIIGENTIISQKSYLCASGHDISDVQFNLVLNPIIIGNGVWVAADSFIGPGVTIKNGAVVGARSAVFKNIDSNTVVGGNPAKFIKIRKLIPQDE